MRKRFVSWIGLQLVKYPETLEWIAIGLLAGIWVERIIDYFYILSRWPIGILYVTFLFFIIWSITLSSRLSGELKSERDCIYRNREGILKEYRELFGDQNIDDIEAHFELYKYKRLCGGKKDVYNYCTSFCYFRIGIESIKLFILYLSSLIVYSFLKAFTGG